MEASTLDPEVSFFELGLDSLVLTQAVGALNKVLRERNLPEVKGLV